MWDWLKRQRNTFLWIAGGTAGVYFLGKYAAAQLEKLAKQAELDALAREK